MKPIVDFVLWWHTPCYRPAVQCTVCCQEEEAEVLLRGRGSGGGAEKEELVNEKATPTTMTMTMTMIVRRRRRSGNTKMRTYFVVSTKSSAENDDGDDSDGARCHGMATYLFILLTSLSS